MIANGRKQLEAGLTTTNKRRLRSWIDEGVDGAHLPQAVQLSHVLRAPGVYLAPRRDGRLIVGFGTNAGRIAKALKHDPSLCGDKYTLAGRAPEK
jgi:hypothetical protein